MPSVGEIFAQRYLLTALIGQRDTAEVYWAEDTALERPVAIKILSPELAREGDFLRRFRSETQAAARLSHVNVISYYDWGYEEGYPYVVTELCLGGSLRDIIDSGARLTPAQAARVGLEMSEGLKHAHEAGLIHGGIAPSNILFDAEGRAKITDFALAVLHAGTSLPSFHDRIFGPSFYASPEEIENSELTEKADVYALALVLVEAVTGTYPFVGETTLSVLWERLFTPLPTPPELLGLAEPIAKASAMKPDERLSTEEFATQLSQVADTLAEPAPLPLVPLPQPLNAPKDWLAGGELELAGGLSAAGRGLAAGGTERGLSTGRGGLDKPEKPQSRRRSRQLASRKNLARRVNARELWVSIVAVAVIILAGIIGFVVVDDSGEGESALPDFVGQRWEDALEEIDGAWAVRRYELRRNGTSVGEILTQQPEAGQILTKGEQLTLTVSLGDELVKLPADIIGLPVDVVGLRLSELGLSLGEITEVSDDLASAGTVLSINEPLLDIPSGGQVDLLVSTGPALLTVPLNLLGADFVATAEELTAAGFMVEEQRIYDDQTASGTILLVTPDSGSVLPAGSTLIVAVSDGPKPVPDLKGLTLGEVRQLLEAEGFCLDSQAIDGSDLSGYDDSDIVSNSVPPAGVPLARVELEAESGAEESESGAEEQESGAEEAQPEQSCVSIIFE